MVEFAGYDMPVLYSGEKGGVMKEHLHCREACGIFDVSHMGQVHFHGKDAAAFLEYMTVVDTQALHHGKASLSLLMNDKGGINDDCIITKVKDDHYYVVLNAGCKDTDMEHMKKYMGDFKDCRMEYFSEDVKSLIAVQGPKAQHVVETIMDGQLNLNSLDFMECSMDMKFDGQPTSVSRCGYTGEDGFEISIPNSHIEAFMEKLWTVKGSEGEQLA
jgi:aminomethyltransferase